MKCKYLGLFDRVEMIIEGEEVTALIPEDEEFLDNDTHRNWFDMGKFMMAGESDFHAHYTECNTSGIGLKMVNGMESVKLWRVS